MSKAQTFDVTITVVPASGKVVEQKVTVPATATVREVLKAGGIDSAKRDFTVDGEPATLDTRVNSVSELKALPVRVTERPQGS